MSDLNFEASRAAMAAVKAIAEEVMELKSRHLQPAMLTMGPLDLAAKVGRLQHAAFIHFLRCTATKDLLELVVFGIEDGLRLLDSGDADLALDLQFVEPYRHYIYARATAAALRASERDGAAREAAHWRSVRKTPKLKIAD